MRVFLYIQNEEGKSPQLLYTDGLKEKSINEVANQFQLY